jgi:hypothetical protein
MRLQEPLNDTVRVEAKPTEERPMTPIAKGEVEVEVEPMDVRIQIVMAHTVRSGSPAMLMPGTGGPELRWTREL